MSIKQLHIQEEEDKQAFAKRAAIAFKLNSSLETWTDTEIKANALLALRFGLDKDCVVVIRIADEEVVNYVQIID